MLFPKNFTCKQAQALLQNLGLIDIQAKSQYLTL